MTGGSPLSSGRRAGGWKRLRRIDSGSDPKTQLREIPPPREVITLDDEDEEERESGGKEERKEGKEEKGKDVGGGTAEANEEMEEEEESGAESCSICLGRGSDPATLDSCTHSFCYVCIFRWCTDICNTCPLCKRTVKQLRHWGPDGPPRAELKTPAGPFPPLTTNKGRGREREGGEGKVVDERKDNGTEESWQSSAEEGDAAATWDVIQFQRASNLRQRRQRTSGGGAGGGGGGGGRGSGSFFHQLSLDASPAPLSDSLQALTAFSTQQPSRVTRSMVKLSQDSLSRSQSPTLSVTQAPPTNLLPPGPLVVSIPDRLQRVSYAEEDIPSPSILNICCERCHTDVDEDRLLLCDGCDEAYHTYCLIPPLLSIPDDEWFCPQCQLEESLRLEEEHIRAQMGGIVVERLSQTPPRRTTTSPRRPRSQQRRRRGVQPTHPRPPPVFAPYREEDGEEDEEEEEDDDDAKDATYPHPSRRAERTAKRASRRVEEIRAANLHRQRQQHEEARQRSHSHITVMPEQSRVTHQPGNQRLLSNGAHSTSTFHSSSSSPSSTSSFSSSSLQLLLPTRAPSSSLSRLSSGNEEALPTLAARMRELQLQKQRAREEQKAQEVEGWMQRGIVESLLDEAVKARDSASTPLSRNGRPGKRERAQSEEEEGTWEGNGGGGQVKRKIPRKSFPTERSNGSSQELSQSSFPASVSFTSLRGGAPPPPASVQTSSSGGISWHSLHSSAAPTAPLQKSKSSNSVRPSSSLASLPSTSPPPPFSSVSPFGRSGNGTPKPSTPQSSTTPSALSASSSSLSSASRALVPRLSEAALGSGARGGAGNSNAHQPAWTSSTVPPPPPPPPSPSPDVIPSFEEFLQQSASQPRTGRLSRSPYYSPPTPSLHLKSHQPPQPLSKGGRGIHLGLSFSRMAAAQQRMNEGGEKAASSLFMEEEDEEEYERPPSPFLQ